VTTKYLGIAGVAAWFGVKKDTVSQWRGRYPDTPPPDAQIGRTPGWLPAREADWKRWYSEKGPGR
jgi:hypothetical protein